MISARKKHWETIYETKNPDQVAWTQYIPTTSLDFINSYKLPKSASIIDIGGGDSKLVDFLLDQGYTNISVLDISARALEKAKKRLGKRSKLVNWIESDIIKFRPTKTYDIWHDRASFHFLTQADQISKYLAIAENHICNYLIIGSFSEQGPTKCSGLEIQQYNEQSLMEIFNKHFEIENCMTENHITPFKTSQNFLFCSFKKIETEK
jgi:SAM-dependent methyltransferase